MHNLVANMLQTLVKAKLNPIQITKYNPNEQYSN